MDNYFIHESLMERLQKRVVKSNAKAAKIGAPPITLTIVGERLVSDPANSEVFDRLVEVRLDGMAPVVNGFTFVARIEHTDAGNIIARSPGEENAALPEALRDQAPICEHCHTHRDRKHTFVLRGPDGTLRTVGRNCLADYLRHEDVEAALQLWALDADLKKDGGRPWLAPCGDGSWKYRGTVALLARAAAAIRVKGWVSKANAEKFGKRATVSWVEWAMRPYLGFGDQAKQEWNDLQPTDADREEAKRTQEWSQTILKAKNPKSDYENNVVVALAGEAVHMQNTGLVVSAVAVCQREREQKAAPPAQSHYIGTVGQREVFRFRVVAVHGFDGDYGRTTLVTFKDEDGNIAKWFAAGDRDDLEVGREYKVAAMVKSHDLYKGQESTKIARAKVEVL